MFFFHDLRKVQRKEIKQRVIDLYFGEGYRGNLTRKTQHMWSVLNVSVPTSC